MPSAQPLSVLVADPDLETRDALSDLLFEEGFHAVPRTENKKSIPAAQGDIGQLALHDFQFSWK